MTSGEDSFSEGEPDFDLKKLANRLSISSMLSETSSNNSAGDEAMPFEAKVGPSGASHSIDPSSYRPKVDSPSSHLGSSTPKAKSRYTSRADRPEEDEAQTPTLLSASQRPSSSAQTYHTTARSASDPLDLLLKSKQDSEWVEAKDHATLGRPFQETSSSRSSDISLSSSIEDWTKQHKTRTPTRSKTIASPNPSSRRSSARFSNSSTSPILPYLIDEEASSSKSTTDDVPKSPLSFASPKVNRSSSISSQRTFSRSGSLSKAPSLTRKHSRSVSRSTTASLTLPQLVRKTSGSSAGGTASGVSEKKRKAVSLEPPELFDVLSQHVEKAKKGESRKPLIVDVRPLPDFINKGRLIGSINCNFPSLLMKRFKRGKVANFSLESFITTEQGKETFRDITKAPPPTEDTSLTAEKTISHALNDVDMFVIDSLPPSDANSVGSILVSVLETILDDFEGKGSLCYLNGRFSDLVKLPASNNWLAYGEELSDDQETSAGLHILPPMRSQGIQPPTLNLPSPSASSDTSSDGKTKRSRLKPLDTVAAAGHSPASAGVSTPRLAPKSPQPLNLSRPSHTLRPSTSNGSLSIQELAHMQSRSPSQANFGLQTQRPRSSNDLTSASDNQGEIVDPHEFVVSCIIPNFLYLGPEPATEEHVRELEEVGVKRVLNMALEVKERPELKMDQRFEKVTKIPMRDFVEETGVQKRIEEACTLLDDASLKSKPVYLHCQAGKSRSVTIAMAYLIHRYHWSFKRAYAHVAERRKGISPNIGFVSSLMRYEEKELGHKASNSINTSQPASSAPNTRPVSSPYGMSVSPIKYDDDESPQTALAGSSAPSGMGRPANRVRESLPPMMPSDRSASDERFEWADSGQEKEFKNTAGNWVQNRRAFTQETFEPNRRASKAGLESNLL